MSPARYLQRLAYRIPITLLHLYFFTICSLQLSKAQTLHTTSAIYSDAQLLNLESSAQLRFQLGERESVITGSQIVRWGSWPGVRDEQAVWLGDGSWLCGDVQFEHESIGVTNDWFKPTTLPLSSLRGAVLSPPTTLERWLELQSQMPH